MEGVNGGQAQDISEGEIPSRVVAEAEAQKLACGGFRSPVPQQVDDVWHWGLGTGGLQEGRVFGLQVVEDVAKHMLWLLG